MWMPRVKIHNKMDMEVHEELLNIWKELTIIDNKKLLYRFTNDNCLEFVLCFYDDKKEALKMGKKLYFNVLLNGYKCNFNYNMGDHFYDGCAYIEEEVDGDFNEYYRNEEFFFSSQRHYSNNLGLMIYEVDQLDDYDKKYKVEPFHFCGGFGEEDITILNNMKKFKEDVSYDEEIQKVFHLFSLVEDADLGERILLLCQILETLSTPEEKSDEVKQLLEQCKNLMKNSDIDQSEKDSLISALDNLKYESSRKKIKKLLDKYNKNNYKEFDKYEVIRKCYSFRSLVIHGESDKLPGEVILYEYYLRKIVLDTIYGWAKDKYSTID